jgi:RNA 3''-terminal phosphate cyclase
MEQFIDIDGSKFEGGGQILRFSLVLSIIKSIPVRIYNIRAGRESPGLSTSHIASVALLSEISNSTVTGNTKGSSFLTFHPGKVVQGNYKAICSTAGSINLILQAVLPILIQTNSRVTITGGSDVSFAPTTHYVTNVFKPFLSMIGIRFDYFIEKHGFYPRGMGKVTITTYPSTPQSIHITENSFFDYQCQILHSLRYESSNDYNSQYFSLFDEVQSTIFHKLSIPAENISLSKVYTKDKAMVVSL